MKKLENKSQIQPFQLQSLILFINWDTQLYFPPNWEWSQIIWFHFLHSPEVTSQTQIRYPDVTMLVQQNIGRFQIPINNVSSAIISEILTLLQEYCTCACVQDLISLLLHKISFHFHWKLHATKGYFSRFFYKSWVVAPVTDDNEDLHHSWGRGWSRVCPGCGKRRSCKLWRDSRDQCSPDSTWSSRSVPVSPPASSWSSSCPDTETHHSSDQRQ